MPSSQERTRPGYYTPLPNPRDYIPYIYNDSGFHEEVTVDEDGEEDLVLTELLASEIALARFFERETRRQDRREKSRLKHGKPEKRNKRIGWEHEEMHQYVGTVKRQRREEKNTLPKEVPQQRVKEEIWTTKIGGSTVKTVGFPFTQL